MTYQSSKHGLAFLRRQQLIDVVDCNCIVCPGHFPKAHGLASLQKMVGTLAKHRITREGWGRGMVVFLAVFTILFYVFSRLSRCSKKYIFLPFQGIT
jgi:hypothetical protein